MTPSHNRSSLREGPLADLFRRTDEAAPESAAASASQQAHDTRYPARVGLDADPEQILGLADVEPRREEIAPMIDHVAETAATVEAWGERRQAPSMGYGPVIRVVGVGGGGTNAVNRMVEAGITGVEFLAINTDAQSLQDSNADVTIHIGQGSTRGLGAGANPNVGRTAAMEEYDEIKAALRGSDMVFIAAGEGGGTGTGAAPVVARVARELGSLTVGIVTKPFAFEGKRRAESADTGIRELADEVDTLIVVPNNRLLSVLERNTSMIDAFRVADDVLRQGVQGISELVTVPGLINLDFADVRTIMQDRGAALLGIGHGTGEARAIQAAERAVEPDAGDVDGRRQGDPALDRRWRRPLAVGDQRGGRGDRRRGPPRRQHHLRRPGRREARRRDLGHRGRHRLRAPAAPEHREPAGRASDAAAGPRARRRAAGRPSRARAPLRPSRRGPGRVDGCRSRRRLDRAGVRAPRALTDATTAGSGIEQLLSRMPASRGIVAAGHPQTAEVGADVLRAGGSAADAAVAAAFASWVCEPLLTGPAAGAHLLAVPVAGPPLAIDAFCAAPGLGATDTGDPLSRLEAVEVDFGDAHQTFHVGGAAVAAFGMIDGLVRLHARWGRLPLADLAAPAAALARAGVALNPQQGYVAGLLEGILRLTAESRALWTSDDRLLAVGDVFRCPELGDTIERLGRDGAGPLRDGDLAAACVDSCARHGGLLSAEDLASYRAVERPPIRVGYRERTVLTAPPPSAGGVLLAIALGRLGADARVASGSGPPDAGELVAAMVGADGERTPRFEDGLFVEGFADELLRLRLGSTTHLSVIDADGLACAITGTNGEGSGVVVPGTGIHLNNVMGRRT